MAPVEPHAPGRALLGPSWPSTDACLADLMDTAGGRAGAVVTFTGVVRNDHFLPEGADAPVEVERLEFETFAEMARDELERIRVESVQRHGLTGCSIIHRTGTLCIGEPIVLVACASAHRQAAFEAAAWTMDELKRRVPLWKREVAQDGAARWVSADACHCVQ